MPMPRKSTTKKALSPKKHKIEMTFGSMVLWSGALLILLAWIFFLGIMVGRGSLARYGIGEEKNVGAQAKGIHELLGPGQEGSLSGKKEPEPEKETKLAFYDRLEIKKETVKKDPETNKKTKPLSFKTAPRKTREAPLESSSLEKKTPSPDGTRYTIQLASLANLASAEKVIDRLIDQGHPAYYFDVEVNGKAYYRIRCGTFKSREEATAYARDIADKTGFKGFVVRME